MASQKITHDELNLLIKLAKKVLWCDRETKRKIEKQGLHIIPARFYSEIPTIGEVENSFEYRDLEKGAFHSDKIFNPKKMLNFLQEIQVYADEFNPPELGDIDSPKNFFWKNPAFSYSDAMAYYCMIRYFKPNQILEIGSGYSTLIASEALQRNGYGDLILIEPYPKPFLNQIKEVKNIITKFIQDIPIFELLGYSDSSDIIFIDSTYTVKNGSDCLYIYLKMLPEIRKDVIVHTHDVKLPFPFDMNQIIDKNITWTEQYLLYAYMLDNPKIEVLFSSTYFYKFFPQETKKLMGGKYPGGGGSIWYSLKGSLN
ncbi:MAG: class I SAM-dependent methyltransferase [Planktothrix rubescens PR222]|jgi:Methyltransferase domain